jgi:ABC-type ATPase involved in cell division
MDVMNIFIDLHKDWKTIIIASHDKNIVDALKKRVIVFKDKEMVSDKQKWVYEL